MRRRHENLVEARIRRVDPVPLLPDQAFVVDGKPPAVDYPTDLALDKKLGLVAPE